ncbi:uncharacterized protein LOC135124601 [Zophobas morio]|uniref:uncharacterized protein LOC135124601 n=1 Tax=Zophobas morio TaxID=2755281 RepID=UPI003082921A
MSENKSVFVKVEAYTLYFTLLILATILTFANLFLGKNADNMQTNLMNRNFICLDFAARDSKEKKVTDECILICRRNSTAYFYGVVTAELLWNLPVVITTEKKLAIYPWLPYDPMSTNLVYGATLLYTMSVTLYTGFAATMMDPLIGGLAYNATPRIKILKYNLRYLGKHIQKVTNKLNEYSTITYKMAYKDLKQCVRHHNQILEKVLLMIMERSKRSMVFTAGAIIDVTLVTFLSVLKTSYSLVTVLNNLDISRMEKMYG